jgi:hypothetical protein
MTVEILLRAVIAALASYRVSRMIALEDGPFDVFNNFRVRFDKPKGVRKSWIGRGVECPLCIGAYASPVMLALSYVDYVFYGVVVLAVAGLQVALQKQERL